MSKIVTIKLTKAGANSGPFTLSTEYGDVLATEVSKQTLIKGISYSVESNVRNLIIESTGKCQLKKVFPLDTNVNIIDYAEASYTQAQTGCLWRHLNNIQIYNTYYGVIEPYIIEYPFSYQFQDEILQNIKDYTKAYKYLPPTNGVFTETTRIETNSEWFNKAVLYNGQQSSGILNLISRPQNNLSAYSSYPIYNTDSKTILYTKSDNFYQYNTFWALNKDSQIPLFLNTCESLSIDKIVNQDNMDYTTRSFKKAPLRAKDLKIRHILDDRSDVHLVSQFLLAPAAISYK